MFPNNFPNNYYAQYPFQYTQPNQGNQNPNQQYIGYPYQGQQGQHEAQFGQQMSMPSYYYQAMQNPQNYPLIHQANSYQTYPAYQQNGPVQVNPNSNPHIALIST